MTAQYPTSVWDGLSPSSQRDNTTDLQNPDGYDYLQIYEELSATQTELERVKASGFEFTATNGQGGALVIGTPVYKKADGTIAKADADGGTILANVVGVVKDSSVADSETATVLAIGKLTATTTQWDAVAGTSGGLSPGTVYYLSTTAGTLVATTPPTGVGTKQYRILTALSATEALVLPNVEAVSSS